MRRLLRRPAQAIDRLADRELRSERRLVEEGHDAERRMAVRSMLWFVITLGCFMTLALTPDGPWDLALSVVVGWALGQNALRALARARAYRSGWLDGRMRFVDQARHHEQQGNTPSVWIETEYLHDVVHVLGLPPGDALKPSEWGGPE